MYYFDQNQGGMSTFLNSHNEFQHVDRPDIVQSPKSLKSHEVSKDLPNLFSLTTLGRCLKD